MILIAIFVDDIVLVSRDHKAINDMKKNLSREFEIRDLGKVSCCLGIQFIWNGSKIIMYQKGYIEDILKRFGIVTGRHPDRPQREVDIARGRFRPRYGRSCHIAS